MTKTDKTYSTGLFTTFYIRRKWKNYNQHFKYSFKNKEYPKNVTLRNKIFIKRKSRKILNSIRYTSLNKVLSFNRFYLRNDNLITDNIVELLRNKEQKIMEEQML